MPSGKRRKHISLFILRITVGTVELSVTDKVVAIHRFSISDKFDIGGNARKVDGIKQLPVLEHVGLIIGAYSHTIYKITYIGHHIACYEIDIADFRRSSGKFIAYNKVYPTFTTIKSAEFKHTAGIALKSSGKLHGITRLARIETAVRSRTEHTLSSGIDRIGGYILMFKFRSCSVKLDTLDKRSGLDKKRA